MLEFWWRSHFGWFIKNIFMYL